MLLISAQTSSLGFFLPLTIVSHGDLTFPFSIAQSCSHSLSRRKPRQCGPYNIPSTPRPQANQRAKQRTQDNPTSLTGHTRKQKRLCWPRLCCLLTSTGHCISAEPQLTQTKPNHISSKSCASGARWTPCWPESGESRASSTGGHQGVCWLHSQHWRELSPAQRTPPWRWAECFPMSSGHFRAVKNSQDLSQSLSVSNVPMYHGYEAKRWLQLQIRQASYTTCIH